MRRKWSCPFETLSGDLCYYISTLLYNGNEVNKFLQASKQTMAGHANTAGFRHIQLNKTHSLKYATDELFRKKLLIALKIQTGSLPWIYQDAVMFVMWVPLGEYIR